MKWIEMDNFDMFLRFLSEYNVYNTTDLLMDSSVAPRKILLGLAIRVASLSYTHMTK